MELQKTVESVTEQLNKRMADFDAELAAVREKSGSPHTLDSLAEDFATFRSDTIAILSNLQSLISILVRDVERLEMRGRRKILLLHGVPEEKGESATDAALSVFSDCLEDPPLGPEAINRCHRMGRSEGEKPRPILVKFRDVADRDRVWFAKKSLKNSGRTLSEFLTASRHKLFMAARTKLGVSKCWTRDGDIFYVDAVGKKRRIASYAELDDIAGSDTASKVTGDSEKVQQVKLSAQSSGQHTAPTTRRRAGAVFRK